MKKVLAFVLVLAMVLGSVSLAFATVNYADQAEITNTEAVNVLSILKVLEGDANGFRPKDTLTRAEAAAICARLMLGREDADKLSATAATFTDVPASHWAAGYIAYCVAEGVIAGNGDGTFDPEGLLTVAAFTKMMLCALGYDAKREGLTGASWEANTAALAVKAGISVPATGACTRESAAQLGLNTLGAKTVEYAQAAVTVNTGGAEVVVGGSNATAVVDNNGYDYDRSEGKAVPAKADYLQLVEKVYGDKVQKNKNAVDDFGNPAIEWTYKTESVTTSKKALATFTKKYSATTNADQKAILNAVKNYSVAGTKIAATDTTSTGALAVNGLNVPAGTPIVNAIAALTENGRLVEVFANSDNEITDVISTNYRVSKITAVTTNSKGDITYTGDNGLTGKDYADATEDTIVIKGTVAKDDYVTYVVKSGKAYVYPATKVTGTQTSKTSSKITVDGTSYTIATGVTGIGGAVSEADFENSKKEANYYLDQFGFVIAATDVEADLVYAVVDRIALKTSTGVSNSKTMEAVLIFLDGTKQTVSVSKFNGAKPADITTIGASYLSNAAIQGLIYSYEIDSDGKYELKSQANTTLNEGANSTLITKGVAKMSGAGIAANTDTIYIVKTYKSGTTDDVINVYTGYANVPTIKTGAGTGAAVANYVVDAKNAAKMVAVYVNATNAEMGGSDKNIFYATQNASSIATVGTGSDAYKTINGYLNGESTTLKFKSSVTSDAGIVKGTFYKLTIADDGYTTNFNSANGLNPATNGGIANDTKVKEVSLGTIDGYTINANTKVFVIDTDYVMSESTATVITSGSNYWFDVVNSTGTTVEKNTVKTLYIKLND